jgi:uncharacterized membrane protein required for colicin V production
MNYIDIVILIAVITGFFIGWKLRGILIVIIPLAIIAGIFAANLGYHNLAGLLVKHIPTESKRFLISYSVIFLVTSSVIIFAGVVLSRFFDFFNLAFIDRIFGAAILISLLLVPLYLLFDKYKGVWGFDFSKDAGKSLMFPYLKTYISYIFKIPVFQHLDAVTKILK